MSSRWSFGRSFTPMDAIKDLTGCNNAEPRSHFAIATIAAVAVLTTANDQTDGRTDRGEEEEEDHNGSCCGHEKICDGEREREPYLMGEELGELASGLIRTGFESGCKRVDKLGRLYLLMGSAFCRNPWKRCPELNKTVISVMNVMQSF